MTDKVFLLRHDEPRRVITPHSDYGVVHDVVCPSCKALELRVQGAGRRVSDDDRAWEADAFSVCCNQRVGTIRAETNTLFGVREDQRVLNGPWLVL